MDRKTLEAVLAFAEHKYNNADRVAANSQHQSTRVDASAQCTAYRTICTWVMWELGSLPKFEQPEPAPVDEALSFNDIRKQLDEARANLARIARLAQEAIR